LYATREIRASAVNREGEMESTNDNCRERVPSRASNPMWPPPWLGDDVFRQSTVGANGSDHDQRHVRASNEAIPNTDWDDADSLTACLRCGALECWHDARDRRHCAYCDP
jgi:hypothetical protein